MERKDELHLLGSTTTYRQDYARNHGDFHEDCVNKIMKDLIRLMDPKYIEVTGIFTPRGGISIYPYCNYGRPGTKYEKLAEQRLFSHNLPK